MLPVSSALADTGNGFHYVLDVDPTLTHVTVEVTLPARRSAVQLSARNGNAADLSWVQTCAGERLTSRQRVLMVPPEVVCLRYKALLDPLFTGGSWGVRLSAATRVASPSQFLWLPDRWEEDVNVTINGTTVSVPWPERVDEPGYRVPDSPESSRGMVVLGDFQILTVNRLRKPVAYVGPAPYRDKLRLWLEHAVAQVTAVSGVFPNPDVQVLVFHVGARGASPVPFGHVIRDQGETVAFYIDAERSLDDFLYDWTATHEFAHLLMPYITGRHKWISEGFASYYQNVLQMRSGSYSQGEGWQRLARSFDRAQRSGQRLSPNGSVRAGMREGRMMIYWSGAALALKADTTLRRRTSEPASLDVLLGRFAACCLPATHTWHGRIFFEQLDALGGNGVMVELFDRYANRRGLPPVEDAFAALGLNADGSPADTAGNALRDAISRARRNAESGAR